MTTMTADERKRGRMLSGWLILMAGLYAILAVVTLTSGMSTLPDTQRIAAPFFVVASIVNVGAVIALWSWRKAGFYVLFLTAIPLVIMNLIFGIQLLTAFFPVYSLSTTWMLLQTRWQYFH